MVPRKPKDHELFTAAERKLIAASEKRHLEKLSPAEVKQHARRARTLFDKWTDVSRRQQRRQSRAVGFPDTRTRSAQKAQAFADVVARFESRTAELERADGASSGRARSGRGAAARKTPKKLRQRGHRADRAAVREQLEEKRAALAEAAGTAGTAKSKRAKPAAKTSASKSPAPKSAASKSAAPRPTGPKSAVKSTAKSAAAKPAAKATATKSSAGGSAEGASDAKPRGAKRPGSITAAQRDATPSVLESLRVRGELPALIKDSTSKRARQLDATTAAKQRRVVKSGLTTRVRGHVSARGRRTQARRDARN